MKQHTNIKSTGNTPVDKLSIKDIQIDTDHEVND